jgi:hypothetical protein
MSGCIYSWSKLEEHTVYARLCDILTRLQSIRHTHSHSRSNRAQHAASKSRVSKILFPHPAIPPSRSMLLATCSRDGTAREIPER